MLKVSYLYSQRSNRIMCQIECISQRYGVGTVLSGASRRPILVAFDSGALLETRQHHDGDACLFPDHTPEVVERLLQWSLLQIQ